MESENKEKIDLKDPEYEFLPTYIQKIDSKMNGRLDNLGIIDVGRDIYRE
ncbi:MAG: hypothetical protein ABEK36_01830 [Candidatus Aenigmatarchaeota archaeon]